jgi:hypothetical protein
MTATDSTIPADVDQVDEADADEASETTTAAPVRVDVDAVIALVLEAVALPYPATVGDSAAYDDLLRHRVMHLVQTLPHLTTTAAAAHPSPDIAAEQARWHVDYLRARLAELPVTYTTVADATSAPEADREAVVEFVDAADQVAADLRAAASVVRERGLARGALCDKDGRVCLIGAIRVAVTGSPATTQADHDTATAARLFRAETAVDEYLADLAPGPNCGGRPGVWTAASWNDRAAGTAEQAAELLETVAAGLAAGTEATR